MSRLADEELSISLHQRRSDARCVPLERFVDAKPNDCHENARKYAEKHPGCTLIRGWLIEQFFGWNYFIAHTVIELPSGAWIDPTPMSGQYPFLRHAGSDADFEEQRTNRPQVQFIAEVNPEDLQALLSQLAVSAGEPFDVGAEIVCFTPEAKED